ncbi:MAG: hypothetical protein PHT59_01565 [Candidatus Omnitrophica bacterium]|nr:hypothetical protein [Candidatus Omnitrophota bacterium]
MAADKGPAFDEAPKTKEEEKLPIHAPIIVIRYRTIKKNMSLGWWSAIALVEDHGKKQVCFYRWRRVKNEWKRAKKLAFRSRAEWQAVKEGVESFLGELEA